MVFTDIRLQNFRSYGDSSFEMGKGVNIVVGPNTAGKTNLLEAIMVASAGKSYRAKDPELIKNGKDWARIDVHDDKSQQRTVKIVSDGKSVAKSFELDKKQLKKLSYDLRRPVVLFEPNHLFLFHDEPRARRDFLDNLLAQTNPEYTKILNDYKRILSQRNALLKQNKAKDQIFVWNFKLTDTASKIATQRQDLIAKINESLSKVYSELANKDFKLILEYKSDVSLNNYGSDLLKKLEANFTRDREMGFTGNGPHRDDLVTSLGGSLVSDSASRGEIRTLMLSLKIIETKLITEITGRKPMMLLDDVFSELDGARRKSLTDFLKDYQTIITTTDADLVVKNFTQNCQVIPLV